MAGALRSSRSRRHLRPGRRQGRRSAKDRVWTRRERWVSRVVRCAGHGIVSRDPTGARSTMITVTSVTSATTRPIVPTTFSSQERFLVDKSELAIVKGLQLERWMRDPNRKIQQHELALNRPYKRPNR